MSYKKRYVRVVLEGEARENTHGDLWMQENLINPTSKHVKSIEDIPEPEDFRKGDIVRSSGNFLYQKTKDGWNFLAGQPAANTHRRDDVAPTRPLTLLVRDGKVVK